MDWAFSRYPSIFYIIIILNFYLNDLGIEFCNVEYVFVIQFKEKFLEKPLYPPIDSMKTNKIVQLYSIKSYLIHSVIKLQ